VANRKTIRGKTARFCYYYHLLRNGGEAAIKAGFFPALADYTAQKLLQREDVIEKIEQFDAIRTRQQIRKDAVAGLRRLAFSAYNDSISLLFSSEEELSEKLSTLDLYPICEIKKPKENMLEIKFFDRVKALEKLLTLSEEENRSDGLVSLYQALEHSASTLCKHQTEQDE
jgi:hypothetical protein